MKAVVLFIVIFAVARGIPLPEDPVAGDVLPYNLVRDDLGQYALSYLTNDVSHVEQGALRQIDGAVVLVKQGKFLHVDKNGNRFLTTYVADEHGFHPIGDHIPVTQT